MIILLLLWPYNNLLWQMFEKINLAMHFKIDNINLFKTKCLTKILFFYPSIIFDWFKKQELTVYFYHVTYAFQGESTL